jgi:hypothetical protein
VLIPTREQAKLDPSDLRNLFPCVRSHFNLLCDSWNHEKLDFALATICFGLNEGMLVYTSFDVDTCLFPDLSYSTSDLALILIDLASWISPIVTLPWLDHKALVELLVQ